MKVYEPDNDDLYSFLKNEIDELPSVFIPLERLYYIAEKINPDMPVFLQSPQGQATFCQAVKQLVTEQLIVAVGKKPHTQQGLHKKYRINKNPINKDDQLAMEIIKKIVPPATIDYYIKNPREFLDDLIVIDAMVNFFGYKDKDIITANERAYQLFGDEKFFKGAGKSRSRGETVLKRLGLSYAHLRCEETVEPFFSFQKKDFHLLEAKDVYIIENKDTFWSLKRTILDAPSIIKADMLVYGEGKKIISSFKFISEYDINALKDKFHYFGDLDAEGINIYCELVDEYPDYNITPFIEGYQAILEIGLKRSPVKTPKEQKIKSENITRFIKAFDQSWAVKLQQHLEEGFYIPQEALSATAIKERFGVN
ncbi:MAG: DUF2220 family protein [Syntrophomonadaceae bacterium]|nr:DUF2220 family protein [Syntrophomonadaceae bacterium]